ncbi:MAG: hypothetical protein JO172_08880 [Hyphomicrobiales bacterium]|nr:hypothetical protein [Hyphomicrobiales bacterium]
MAQTEERDEIDELAARFAAMPEFPLAVRAYVVNMMHMRQNLRLLNKLISHHARWRIAAFLLYLDADRERFGPDGGATYSNLLGMCQRRAEIKPRVLKTVLALLQITGSVSVVRRQDDRRSKFYRPTERMHEFTRQWMGHAAKMLEILEPEKRRSELLGDDPGFSNRFLVSSGRAHLTSVPLIERMPKYIARGARDGADAVQLDVLLADMDGVPVPSRAMLAKKYGFSKTQITAVIAEGVAQGSYTLNEVGVPMATPYLRKSFSKWVSIELAFYAVHMRVS